jgi:hypothetical protein
MQRFIIFFIIVYALHVSGGFSAHHQELKNKLACCYCYKQAWHIPDAVCTVLELLMMGGETAQNMYSTDNNKEYYKMLHLVGCT